jgi:hypothetical protein
MPLKFITLLTGQIREIAASFMHLFIRRNALCRFDNSYESDFFFEYILENISNFECKDFENKQHCDLLHSYQNGEISVFLNEIYDYTPIDVISALNDYKPANPMETKLLECFKKGLPFVFGNKCIMNYDYVPEYDYYTEEYDDTSPVALDRIIRYVYDLDDFFCNELESMTNQCIQETYAVEPVSFMILDADSKLFTIDDYPERFFEWFLEMVNLTIEIVRK